MSMAYTKKCRKALAKHCGDIKTKQEFAKEADINNIIGRMERGQLVPNNGEGQFADISNIGDLATMMRTVTDADRAFMDLSPKIRNRFDNDPRKLVAYLEDATNLDEAIELGLVKKPKAQPPAAPPPAASPSTPPPAKAEPTKEPKPPTT